MEHSILLQLTTSILEARRETVEEVVLRIAPVGIRRTRELNLNDEGVTVAVAAVIPVPMHPPGNLGGNHPTISIILTITILPLKWTMQLEQH